MKTRTYTTRTGATQHKPPMSWVEQADNEGFCLACGNTQAGIEPDARKCICEACKAPKVYGNEELALMGLTY